MLIMSLSTNTNLYSAITYIHNSNNNNNNKSSQSRTPSNLIFQIDVPIMRPKQYNKTPIPSLTQPIKHIQHTHKTTTSSNSHRRKKSSSSDILRLIDNLSLSVQPDLYVSLMKECTFSRDSTRALELYSHLNQHRLKLNLPLINRLLLMLVSCGHLNIARQVFDQIPLKKDFNCWAIIIVGYFNNALYQEAFYLFINMLNHHHDGEIQEFPTWFLIRILKACAHAMDMGLGKQVHGLLLKLGRANDLSLSISLFNFYGKFRCTNGANFVFDQYLHCNFDVWMAKLTNDFRQGRFYEVMKDFEEMGKAGIKRNNIMFSKTLRACTRMTDGGNCGRQVHANAIKLGLESDVFLRHRLIEMYGKYGIVQDAKQVFEMRKTSCWKAMFVAYMQNGFYVEALKFLYQMKAAGINVRNSVINKVRIACGSYMLERNELIG